MLGWDFNVWRTIDPLNTPAHLRRGMVCHWTTGLAGVQWIDAMVQANFAKFEGGNGYPLFYSMKAATFRQLLVDQPPFHLPKGLPGAVAIASDYILPLNSISQISLNKAEFDACDPNETLSIEVWDLS